MSKIHKDTVVETGALPNHVVPTNDAAFEGDLKFQNQAIFSSQSRDVNARSHVEDSSVDGISTQNRPKPTFMC